MIDWKIHHKTETVSTNVDARAGVHGDVFTADYQTAGRGRLDHKWESPRGKNIMMSVVLDVAGLDPEHVATLPLVVGLAVARGVEEILVATRQECRVPVGGEEILVATRQECRVPVGGEALLPRRKVSLKWPNDVLIGGRKVAGILCERKDDCVIAGIGVNVKRQRFSPEIADRAIAVEEAFCDEAGVPRPRWRAQEVGARHSCLAASVSDAGRNAQDSLRAAEPPRPLSVETVRDVVLRALSAAYELWREGGFAAVYPAIREIDFLRGQSLAVRQTDDDVEPVRGVCGGINADGSLDVGGVKIYAGEAHVEAFR